MHLNTSICAGRRTSETSTIGTSRALGFQYDAASNRTRITWPDGVYAHYTYDALNRVDQIGENGVFTGASLLADYAYDPLSRRASVTRGNGTVSTYAYDSASRLTGLTQDLAGGAANDQTYGFTYTAASQIAQRTAANDNYNWTGPNVTRTYARNGLNQYTSVSGTSFTYDARGNLTSDGARTFTYDLENHLTSVSGPAALSLAYDPLGRLRQTTAAGATTDFLYDGDRLVAEYNGAGAVLRRYVHGPGVDEPLAWYEGAGLTDRRYLIANHQGSVIAEEGSATTRYAYGPYGEPDSWTGARFRYTGQIALPEAQLFHYKARVYDPILGRFLQTDPVGYEDDVNLYVYTRNDPLNHVDQSGEFPEGLPEARRDAPVVSDAYVTEHPPSPAQIALAAGAFVGGAAIIAAAPEVVSGLAVRAGVGVARDAVVGALRQGPREGSEAASSRASEVAAPQREGALRSGLMRSTNMTPPSQAGAAVARPTAPRTENPALRTSRNETRDNRMVDRQNAAVEGTSRRPGERETLRARIGRAIEEALDDFD